MVLFQDFTDLHKTVPLILTKSLSASKFSNLKVPSDSDIESLSKQFPKTIVSFLQPATFFLAHSEWPPRSYSDLRVPIGTIVDYITLKASYARNRIAMAKYDTTGNGTLDREHFIAYYRNEVMSAVDVLKDLEV
uniref:EF-hand domain-containing protein n=1 Tax=Meloidogyne hapla TaxID=6305 RepID=A0A1I8AXZ8_MELHA